MNSTYGFYKSPFGESLIALTEGGDVCHLSFVEKGTRTEALAGLYTKRGKASFVRSDKKIAVIGKKIFSGRDHKIRTALEGTPFQIKVWKALQTIPRGKTFSYKMIAEKIGSPKAVRAVGTACGANRIAVVVPCHRVLASDGTMGGYRWGIARKKALLEWEAI